MEKRDVLVHKFAQKQSIRQIAVSVLFVACNVKDYPK
jgi:hypothetical protein